MGCDGRRPPSVQEAGQCDTTPTSMTAQADVFAFQLGDLKASGSFRQGLGEDSQTDEEVKYSEVLAEIGAKRGIDSVPPVALAYLFSKYPHVFPVVGVQNKQVGRRSSLASPVRVSPSY